MQSDLEHLLIVQRRYTMRQLHLRQLKTLEILPASQSVNIVMLIGSVTQGRRHVGARWATLA